MRPRTTAISFHDVSKAYRLQGARYGTLRDDIVARLRKRETPERIHWALRDVSFAISTGEAVGIVGHNGAGKSTVLKLISRITRPTSGGIEVNGRIGTLIEVGAGFHPELSGRENIRLYGTILGMSPAEIVEREQPIIEYAGLSEFIDVPIKRYSSGMHVRLGFAVAVHANPSILLMDEVLAVGDVGFQQRCLDTVRELRDSGRTIVLVSHNMRAVESMCHRVIWLDAGSVRMDGSPAEVFPAYLKANACAVRMSALGGATGQHSATEALSIAAMDVLDATASRPAGTVQTGDPIVVRLHCASVMRVIRPHFAINFYGQSGQLVMSANMVVDGHAPADWLGGGTLDCCIESLPLMPGTYLLAAGAADSTGSQILARMERLAVLEVESVPTHLLAMAGPAALTAIREVGPVYFRYRWSVPSAE